MLIMKIQAHEVKKGDQVKSQGGTVFVVLEVLPDGNIFMERVTGRGEWSYTPNEFNRAGFSRIKT